MTRRIAVLAAMTILLSCAPLSADEKKQKAEEGSQAAASQLKQAVADGTLSKEEAIAKFKELAGEGKAKGKPNGEGKPGKGKAAKGKGKGKAGNGKSGKGRWKNSDGSVQQFYSIVVGTLKSKEVELGEFTMDVDYVVGGRQQINNQLIGKRVKVTGVSGEFRDKLLLLRRGTSMKFRSGRYFPDTNSLGFGYKFHVLEATAPFDPADYGVPPDEFRGFAGVLQGEIVETGGYELMLKVNEIEKIADGNSATNTDSIKGKRIRVENFLATHGDAYSALHPGDTIRLSIAHRNRTDESFTVTELLETIGE